MSPMKLASNDVWTANDSLSVVDFFEDTVVNAYAIRLFTRNLRIN